MDPEVNSPPVVTRRLFPWVLLGLFVVALTILGFMYFRSRQNAGFVSGFVENPETLLSVTDNRTNIAFLGIGGGDHSAGDLTDSMMFISLDHQTHEISLLSVPRDIWVDTMVAKLNTAYHYGEQRREGGGLDLASSAISEVLGQPVHYALALDFAGFTQAIDLVGGVDIDVQAVLDDKLYPIPGKETAEPESDRYEHLFFDLGMTHMDGATALKFARSRHAEGDEGTDFARSRRQQQIIQAFQDKLLSSNTFLSLDTLQALLASFRSSLETNIQDDEFGGLLRFFLTYSKLDNSLDSFNLDELFLTPKNRSPYQGQWVLVPVNNWEEIHDNVAKNL